MNIFVLDEDPTVAAKYHCDKHVVKMILESGQLLSTVHRKYGYDGDELYKSTHANHPCAIWLRETSANYSWTYELFEALCDEYTVRYGKTHATARLLEPLSWMPGGLPDGELTPFAQAMPDEVRDPNAVVAYRNYYKSYKADIAVWKYTPQPDWWINER